MPILFYFKHTYEGVLFERGLNVLKWGTILFFQTLTKGEWRREDGLIAYISDFHSRCICIETYFMNFILFIFICLYVLFFYVFSFIGLNLSHRNQKVSLVHTEFLGENQGHFKDKNYFFKDFFSPIT